MPRYILDKSKGQTCFFGISIGNPNQSGEKLEATIDAINDNFKDCIIGISDTLQIPNHMAKGLSKKDARDLAIQNRNRWMSKNQEILKKLTVKHKIQYWDETMSLPSEHGDLKKLFKSKYESDTEFRQILDRDVKKFTERNTSFLGNEHLCRDFLFTELDGYSRVGQTGKYVKIYPGNPPEIVSAVQSGQFDWAIQGLENLSLARIYFSKVAQNNNEQEKEDLGLVA